MDRPKQKRVRIEQEVIALYVYLQSGKKRVKIFLSHFFFQAPGRDDRSRTPILSAALESPRSEVSNAELVEYLMDNGADITAVDDKGSIHI